MYALIILADEDHFRKYRYLLFFVFKSRFVVVFFVYLALVTSIQNNFLFVFAYNEHIVNKVRFRKTYQQIIKNVGCS